MYEKYDVTLRLHEADTVQKIRTIPFSESPQVNGAEGKICR